MTIPVLNFPIHHIGQLQNSEQSNPELVGESYGRNRLKEIMELQKAIMAQKYQEPEIIEKLRKLKSENAASEFSTSPQMLQAALAEAMLKAPKMRADIADTISSTKARDILSPAQAENYNLQNKYYPEELNLKNKMFEWQKNKFAHPNIAQFGRLLSSIPAESRLQWLAEHPEYEELLNNTLNNISSPNAGSSDRNINLENGQSRELGGQLKDNENVEKNLTQGIYNNISKSIANNNKDLSRKLIANNKMITRAARDRADSAIIMEKWLAMNRDEYSKRILNAVKYSTAKGQSRKALDALMHSNPEMYQDYLWLKDNFAPNMGNQIRMMEKMSATQETTKSLDKMLNTINWDRSPAQSLELANRLFHDMGSLAESVLSNAEPSYKGVRRKLNALPEYNPNEEYIAKNNKRTIENSMPANALSDNNLAKVANKYGISASELKQYLRSERVQV